MTFEGLTFIKIIKEGVYHGCVGRGGKSKEWKTEKEEKWLNTSPPIPI